MVEAVWGNEVLGLEFDCTEFLSLCVYPCMCVRECVGRRGKLRYIYLWYGGFLSNSLSILADETDSQSWRSPLKAISEFFKGDSKGDFMETGLHFPIGCCSN